MDPVTLTAASLASTAIGGGISAYGAMQSGSAQAGMYNYQAGIAQMNQQIAKQNADYARFAGEVEAQMSGMQTRAQIGETRAAQGAGGLDVNSGSNKAVQVSEKEIGDQNAGVIRSNAARKAYGYEVEAAQATAQSQLFKMSADQSIKAGKISALSSLIGAGSSVASKWLGASNAGVFGSPGGSSMMPDVKPFVS